mgnify:CR=1 FL=1
MQNYNLDQIVFSSKHLNEIFIIDHSTTTLQASGHDGGNSNNGGDILYRWGNPANYGRGNNSNQKLNFFRNLMRQSKATLKIMVSKTHWL